MSERQDAIRLAEKILERPCADPDDDLAMLGRQLLRYVEAVDKLKKELTYDPGLDLVHANRDEILRKHEEAALLIRVVTARPLQDAESKLVDIHAILDALSLFHPMHTESWKGWPK